MRKPGRLDNSEKPGARLALVQIQFYYTTSCVADLGQVDICASVSSSQTGKQSTQHKGTQLRIK